MATTITRRRFRSTTIRRGRREPVSTAFHDAPPLPADSFTVANLGSGAQITQLVAGGLQTNFANAPMWRLFLWDGYQNPMAPTAIIEPNTMGTAVVVQTSGGFSATWTHGVYGTVAVTGAWAGGEMELLVSVSLGAIPAALYASWAVEFEHAVLPWEVPNKDRMAVAMPKVNGYLHRDATAVLANDLRMLHGHQLELDGGVPHGMELGVADYGCMQMAHVYQIPATTAERARYGCMFRTNDTEGRYKEFCINGTGDAAKVKVRMWNANNLAVGAGFTSDYAMTIVPVAGGWHEAAERYRAEDIAAGAPSVSRGKIKDDAGDFVAQFIKDAPMLMWIQPTDDDASYAKALLEVERVIAYFGVTPVVYFYEWHANPIGDNTPDWSPVRARAETLIASLDALGVRVICYTLLHGWSTGSAYIAASGTPPTGYNAAYGVPGTQVCVAPSGVPYASTLADVHAMPNLGRAGARNHIVATWPLALNGGSRAVSGFYLDALWNSGCQDYAPDLTTAQKGVGAGYYHAGKRALVTAMRAACRAIVPDFACTSEFANDVMNDLAELCHVQSYDYLSGEVYLPLFQAAFSEYALHHGFDCFSTIPPSTAGTGLLRDFRWVYTKHLHDGKLLMLQVNASNVYLPFVGDPNDANYAFWVQYVKPLTDWVKTLVQAWDGPRQLRKYFRGRRLHPLPGSYDAYVEVNGATSEPIADPVEVNHTNAEVQSSVWQTDELTGSPIAVVLTNHGDDEASFQVVMSPERYPEMAGKDNLAKDGASMMTFFGAFRYTVTIPALSVVVLELT